MIGQNTIAKSAVAALLALSLASCMAAEQYSPDSHGGARQQAGSNALAQQSRPDAHAADTAIHQTLKSENRGPEQDPNLPDLSQNLPGAPITWSANGRTVMFKHPRAVGGYLGFIVKGSKSLSLIENDNDKKVYSWSLPEGAAQGTLAVFAGSVQALRTDDILALRNSQYAEGMLSDRGIRVAGSDATPANPQSVPAVPPVQLGASGQMRGSSAKIAAGVLTFTVNDADSPDNGKQMKYKVARGAMMMNPNAPADASGIAGQWIADDPNDKDGVLLFFVQGNGAVAMQGFSGMAAAAMKRMAAMAPAR